MPVWSGTKDIQPWAQILVSFKEAFACYLLTFMKDISHYTVTFYGPAWSAVRSSLEGTVSWLQYLGLSSRYSPSPHSLAMLPDIHMHIRLMITAHNAGPTMPLIPTLAVSPFPWSLGSCQEK